MPWRRPERVPQGGLSELLGRGHGWVHRQLGPPVGRVPDPNVERPRLPREGVSGRRLSGLPPGAARAPKRYPQATNSSTWRRAPSVTRRVLVRHGVPYGAATDTKTPKLAEYAGVIGVRLGISAVHPSRLGGSYDQLDVAERVGVVDRRS